jgi:uncharacterized protein
MRTIETIFREIEGVPDFAMHSINSVHYTNGHGDTPLHIVSYWGDCEAISILVANGANINATGESGFTALHCAAQMNKPEAIQLLLKLGAKPDIHDSNNLIPLELAKILKLSEAVKVLTCGI